MRTKTIGLKILVASLLVAFCLLGAFSGGSANAQSSVKVGDTPLYLALHHNTVQSHALARNSGLVQTIPYWSDVFNYQGLPYPFQMVGTNPANGSANTTVRTEIIPLRLVFSNGTVFDGSKKSQLTVNSPIFSTANYSSGKNLQYGDAIQRAEFWKFVSKGSKHYHVNLSTRVLPTITMAIPANDGSTASNPHTPSITEGLVDIDWFDTQIQALISDLHISPKTFPIFLTYNVFLYENGDPTQCCVIGYHSAIFGNTPSGNSTIQTYAWSSYNDPGMFSVPIEDINALSHETAEWLNDPFVDNVTPTWLSPIAPQYGCNNFLEVGDPLVGVVFPVKTHGHTYHPQDEAFFSWFAKQPTSWGINHQYTYLGTFTVPSPTC